MVQQRLQNERGVVRVVVVGYMRRVVCGSGCVISVDNQLGLACAQSDGSRFGGGRMRRWIRLRWCWCGRGGMRH